MSKGVNAHTLPNLRAKPAATRNVIIIDDNPHDMAAMEKMVSASRAPSCNTTSFRSLGDAINSGKLPIADLILLDDHLDGGTKAEHSLKTLREAGVACPAIVVSAVVRRKRDQTVLRHGAVQFTSKEELDAKAMQRLLAYGLTAQGLWTMDGT